MSKIKLYTICDHRDQKQKIRYNQSHTLWVERNCLSWTSENLCDSSWTLAPSLWKGRKKRLKPATDHDNNRYIYIYTENYVVFTLFDQKKKNVVFTFNGYWSWHVNKLQNDMSLNLFIFLWRGVIWECKIKSLYIYTHITKQEPSISLMSPFWPPTFVRIEQKH